MKLFDRARSISKTKKKKEKRKKGEKSQTFSSNERKASGRTLRVGNWTPKNNRNRSHTEARNTSSISEPLKDFSNEEQTKRDSEEKITVDAFARSNSEFVNDFIDRILQTSRGFTFVTDACWSESCAPTSKAIYQKRKKEGKKESRRHITCEIRYILYYCQTYLTERLRRYAVEYANHDDRYF